jgi:hypothetical protein
MASNKVRHAFRKPTPRANGPVITRRFSQPVSMVKVTPRETPAQLWDDAFNAWAFGKVA